MALNSVQVLGLEGNGQLMLVVRRASYSIQSMQLLVQPPYYTCDIEMHELPMCYHVVLEQGQKSYYFS